MAVPKEIETQLLGLPTSERARLAKVLLVSLESEIDEDVDELWAAESERRLSDFQQGLVEPIEASAALKEARQALQ